MFKESDIVKVLIPNVINNGYDYRLTANAKIGDLVRVSVMNRPYVGVIIGYGDSNLPAEKIKNVMGVISFNDVDNVSLTFDDLCWIQKMSNWTMMNMGAVLKLILNVPDAFTPPKQEQLYSFNKNHNKKLSEKRQLVMDAFASNDWDVMSANDIQNISKITGAVIRNMIKDEILIPEIMRNVTRKKTFVYDYENTGNIVLNAGQQAAADEIGRHISDKAGFGVFLLDGITGSGKTQVYFDSVWRAYNSGKSVLLMMPEIALTAQFINRFKDRFGFPPVVWHSNLTSANRRDIWRGVAMGDIKIIVGTRSALFLPWQDLGLIIIDEEHDGSYKQEDMGNYHARDMAILKAAILKIPTVLASATPAAETINNVNLGKYKKLSLTSRFGGASLPTIETIDMRTDRPETYMVPNDEKPIVGNISGALAERIRETLDKQQQVLLFINRRGFSPIVQCQKCGWVAECPDCSVGMTYHKTKRQLLCHMCGRAQPMYDVCPDCGDAVYLRGVGLERVEQEVRAKFPDARTALVSSDLINSRQSLERLVDKMESGEIDIVIGTQILAKGHHFPNLTLVAAVDSDMGLYSSDFRAAEHSFQQLFQVAGRAGRGKIPGRVLLQTYQPEHPVFDAMINNGRDEFMARDMESRRSAQMPPFGNLIAIIIEGQKESVLHAFCKDLGMVAPALTGGKIMGPINAEIYQIRNWYRMRFLVSGGINADLQSVVKLWLNKIKTPTNVRVKIDVNPQNFM